MRSTLSKIVYGILGIVVCFFPFLVDLFSADKRFPLFTFWFVSFFRPASKNITRRILLEYMSKYYLFCSVVCIVLFFIVAIIWFTKKIKSENEFPLLKAKYSINWIFAVITVFVLQLIYWLIKVEPALEGSTQSYALLGMFLFLLTIGTFLLLPLSIFFPQCFSNVPFFSKK